MTNLILEFAYECYKIKKSNNNSILESYKFRDFLSSSENNIIKYLIDHKGFEQVKYEQTWSTFGWASVVYDDWKEDVDENMYKIRQYIQGKEISKSIFDNK